MPRRLFIVCRSSWVLPVASHFRKNRAALSVHHGGRSVGPVGTVSLVGSGSRPLVTSRRLRNGPRPQFPPPPKLNSRYAAVVRRELVVCLLDRKEAPAPPAQCCGWRQWLVVREFVEHSQRFSNCSRPAHGSSDGYIWRSVWFERCLLARSVREPVINGSVRDPQPGLRSAVAHANLVRGGVQAEPSFGSHQPGCSRGGAMLNPMPPVEDINENNRVQSG